MAKNGLLNSVGKIFEALFLPVAGAAGEKLKKSFEERYSEKRLKRNRDRIFDHASKTLGSKRQEPGQVPPKIVRDVLYHGSVCEDELSGKYIGGVLASSRSGINRDDRGSSFIQLIGRLSTYQIRSHFIFYTIFKRLCAGESSQLGRFTELQKFTIWIPFDVWQIAMDFEPNEQQGVRNPHILYGLSHEDLIDARWAAGGGSKRFKDYGIQVDADGIVYLPSAVGAELYLWAHGLSETPVSEFLVKEFTPMTLDGLMIPDGAKRFIIDRPLRNGLTVTAGKSNGD